MFLLAYYDALPSLVTPMPLSSALLIPNRIDKRGIQVPYMIVNIFIEVGPGIYFGYALNSVLLHRTGFDCFEIFRLYPVGSGLVVTRMHIIRDAPTAVSISLLLGREC